MFISLSMQKNKVFTLGPVAINSVIIAPDFAAMIKSQTLASHHTYISRGCSC